MPTEDHNIDVWRKEDHYEASIVELAVTVTGATKQEALENALREIIVRRMEQTRTRKGVNHRI